MVGVKDTKGFKKGAVIDGVFVRPPIDGEILSDSSPVHPLVETEPVTIEGIFSVVAKPTETSALALTVNYNDGAIFVSNKYALQVILDGAKHPDEPPTSVVDLTV